MDLKVIRIYFKILDDCLQFNQTFLGRKIEGFEPTNLLRARQTLYQLSYTPIAMLPIVYQYIYTNLLKVDIYWVNYHFPVH